MNNTAGLITRAASKPYRQTILAPSQGIVIDVDVSKQDQVSDLSNESKMAKIRNQYNQAPHLTQDADGKVTTAQLDITNESQEDSPLPAGDHKASINRRARNYNKKKQDRNIIKDSQA